MVEMDGVSDKDGEAETEVVTDTDGVSEDVGVTEVVVDTEMEGVSDKVGETEMDGVTELEGVSDKVGEAEVVAVTETVGVGDAGILERQTVIRSVPPASLGTSATKVVPHEDEQHVSNLAKVVAKMSVLVGGPGSHWELELAAAHVARHVAVVELSAAMKLPRAWSVQTQALKTVGSTYTVVSMA